MKNILLILSVGVLFLFVGCNSNDGLSFEEQVAQDQLFIDDYLSLNNINTEVDDSGVRYVVNAPGDGLNPKAGDRVAVKFTAFDLDDEIILVDTIGLVVDLNNQVIPSWTFVLPNIKEGGSVVIYSPSGYAFGRSGSDRVSPNQILIFEMELVAIIDDSDELLEVESALIDEFLTESEISFEVHSSGIRFTTIEEGTGVSPTASDIVSVVYEGTFLNGTTFTLGSTPTLFDLETLIPAWKIMIPEMKEGGKMKFYAPSRYCYGETGSSTIAPNIVLVFEIDLREVRN